MASVAFYISGHGFGHASRQIEIARAFARRRPDVGILVRTTAPRWLFDRTLTVPFVLDDRPCDTGAIQVDSLHLDAAATIARAREFYATLDARAADETPLLREHDVRVIVADAPPLGCAAAARAGIPSVVVSNFTWDWIYAEYREHLDSAPDLIPAIEAAYRLADAAWRLPMHGGFETFDPPSSAGARTRRPADGAPAKPAQDLVDVPFVARHATHEPAETRARLGLPPLTDRRRLVLPSFGGYGVAGIDLSALDLDSSWHLVLVPDAAIYEAGLRYEDLVHAADVVLTKPGYGIISECIANDTALVYTSRGRFAEYDVLVREMPRYLRCAFIDNDALLGGRWRGALDTAVQAPPPPEHPPTNGADVNADMIAAYFTPPTA